MAKVYVGSARGDENGKAHGGQAGDQTAREVSTQTWYKHSKGWRVLRALNAEAQDKIGEAMEMACDNANIGYDQYQRDTLLKYAAQVGYDVSKVNTPCETDCSALTRVCCAYAFGRDIVAEVSKSRFYTGNLMTVLLKTELFQELEGDEYTCASDRLMRGDILCTKTKGHVVVVLNDGDNAGATILKPSANDRPMLREGSEGEAVKTMQEMLEKLKYDLGEYGVDGDFGPDTEKAVKSFQKASRLEVDGICGPKTWAALEAATYRYVVIKGGDCWARTAPNTTGQKLGVARSGSKLQYGGLTADNGWHLVVFDNMNAWVSGKYGKLEA